MRKIATITGTRAEYGLLRPILLKIIEDSELELHLIVTGTHLSEEFGYTIEDISQKLVDAGLNPLVFWDFTYPVFWLMRRAYTRLKAFSVNVEKDILTRTAMSSSINAWEMPLCSSLLSKNFHQT